MKKTLILLLFFVASKGFAVENQSSENTSHSFGVGLQHAFIGYQFAYYAGKNRFHGALGLPLAASVGYQRYIGSKNRHAVGANASTMIAFADFLGATYNYYVNGYSNQGFVFGVEAGQARIPEDSIVSGFTTSVVGGLSGSDTDKVKIEDVKTSYYFINLGYQF